MDSYYYQVQGLLNILNLNYCDFVVYTPKFLHAERIAKDLSLFDKMVPVLKEFYFRYQLPELTLSSELINEEFFYFSEEFYKDVILKYNDK